MYLSYCIFFYLVPRMTRSFRKIRIHILFLVKILQCDKFILNFIRKNKETKIVRIILKKSKWKSETSQISKLI